MNIFRLVRLISVFLVLFGCQQTQSQENTFNSDEPYLGGKVMEDILNNKLTIDDISDEKWQQLSAKKIFFGHQSVGNNILSGVKAVLAEHPNIKLNIVESRNASVFNSGVFAHSRVGLNEKPQSKTEDFAQAMHAGVGELVDVSFHKFCFVDVNATSDTKSLFEDYYEQMKKLSETYPDVTFVHMTVPLTSIQTGPKAWVKKILGRKVAGIVENAKRYEYNNFLMETYRETGVVFDLASIEALNPDGKYEIYTYDGKDYPALYRGYTYDGGHLNDVGAKMVAEKFLIFLSGSFAR